MKEEWRFGVKSLAPARQGVVQRILRYIFSSGARVLRWFGGDGSPIFAAYVFHPGTKGSFFVKRTAEGVKQVLKELYVMIWREKN